MTAVHQQELKGATAVDDLSAPTILVDSISGIIEVSGVVIFGCSQAVLQVKSETEMDVVRKVVLRLAIPIGSLLAMSQLFESQAKQMIEAGKIVVGQNAT